MAFGVRSQRAVTELRAKCAEFSATYVEGSYKTSREPFQFICSCGTQHGMTWSHVKQGLSKVLCPSCSLVNRPRGMNHANFRTDLQDRDNRIHGLGYQAWDKQVKKLAFKTCLISGQKGPVAAHHLYNWADFPDLRLEVANGVCISRELHREFHKRYGRRRNTYAQFAEFYQFKTGAVCPLADPVEVV